MDTPEAQTASRRDELIDRLEHLTTVYWLPGQSLADKASTENEIDDVAAQLAELDAVEA